MSETFNDFTRSFIEIILYHHFIAINICYCLHAQRAIIIIIIIFKENIVNLIEMAMIFDYKL